MSDVGLSSEVESVLDDDDLNRVSFVSNEDASGGINDNEEEPIDEVDVIRQRLAQRYPTKSPRRVEEDKISKERYESFNFLVQESFSTKVLFTCMLRFETITN